MSITTILAALAFEDPDDPVLARAQLLAQERGAKLILLHLIENQALDDTLLPPAAQGRPLSEQLIQEATQKAKLQSGTAEVVVQIGKAASAILELAQQRGADLVVIGAGKPKTIRERMFGSTADRVTRMSPAPVLIARGPALPYQRVATAMDFSDAAQAAAQAALRLAPDARHELIHVAEIPLAFEQAMLTTGTSQPEIDRYRTAKSSQARQKLHEIAAQLPAPRQPRIRVLSGDPGQVMIRLARGRHADLLAIGRHGGAPVSRLLTGSVARKILHAATGDVLICGADAQ